MSRIIETFPFDGVVLVDMQDKFVPALRPGAADRIIPHHQVVLRRCREKNVPTAVLEFERQGSTVTPLLNLVRETPNHSFFEKPTPTGFYNFKFIDWLEDLGGLRILLLGINAGACIMANAVDMLRYGFDVYTSPDLIAGQASHQEDDYIGWYREKCKVFDM